MVRLFAPPPMPQLSLERVCPNDPARDVGGRVSGFLPEDADMFENVTFAPVLRKNRLLFQLPQIWPRQAATQGEVRGW